MEVFGQSADAVNSVATSIYVWCTGGALLFGAVALIATYFVNDSATTISREKDKAVAEANKTASAAIERASVADEKAAKANERAAQLEKDASEARLKAEQLRHIVAWRELSERQVNKLVFELRKHPGKINLRYPTGDPEATSFANFIRGVFVNAGWQVAPGSVVVLQPIYGISTSDTIVRNAFKHAAVPVGEEDTPQWITGIQFNYTEIAGAGILYVGSKAAPNLANFGN